MLGTPSTSRSSAVNMTEWASKAHPGIGDWRCCCSAWTLRGKHANLHRALCCWGRQVMFWCARLRPLTGCSLQATGSWARMSGSYLSTNVTRKFCEHAVQHLRLTRAAVAVEMRSWSWEALRAAWADHDGHFNAWLCMPLEHATGVSPLLLWQRKMPKNAPKTRPAADRTRGV